MLRLLVRRRRRAAPRGRRGEEGRDDRGGPGGTGEGHRGGEGIGGREHPPAVVGGNFHGGFDADGGGRARLEGELRPVRPRRTRRGPGRDRSQRGRRASSAGGEGVAPLVVVVVVVVVHVVCRVEGEVVGEAEEVRTRQLEEVNSCSKLYFFFGGGWGVINLSESVDRGLCLINLK